MVFKYVWDQNNPEGYYNRMGFYKTQIELQFITNNLNKNSSILAALSNLLTRLYLR